MNIQSILTVSFYCTDAGNEPVREFLRDSTTDLNTAKARLKQLKEAL